MIGGTQTADSDGFAEPPVDRAAKTRIGRSRIAGDIALAVGSGLLLCLAFPPVACSPVAWIALVPLYLALARQTRPWAAFGTAWVFGVVLFLVGASWFLELGKPPWAMLACIEAIPFGIQAFLCCLILPRLRAEQRPFVFATVWVAGEWMRGWGRVAFPWFLLASSQVRTPDMLQILPITGQWGVSFAIALTAGLLGEALRLAGAERRRAIRLAVAGVLVPALLWTSGMFLRAGTQARDAAALATGPTLNAASVQGNISKESITSDPEVAYRRLTLETYTELTREAAGGLVKPDLILWPETVVPGYLLHDPQLYAAVSTVARAARTSLLVGAPELDGKERYLNIEVLFDAGGNQLDRYDKVQIVPIGEYFPLRSILGPIYKLYGVPDRDMMSGDLSGVLTVPTLGRGVARVGGMICYDDVFPTQARERVRRGAQVLTLITSDQTFGVTAGPQQHADLDVLRAIETRRYLLRSGATGPSEVVAADGTVEAVLGLDRRGVLQRAVPLLSGETFFVRWGDWFPALCTGLAVFAAGVALRQRRAKPEARTR